MVAVENICKINLVESKTLTRFAVRILDISVFQFDYTGNTALIKRGSFLTSQSACRECREFAKLQKSLASFVIHINQIFRRKMRTLAKNLTQTPKVCSVSTSNARKSVTSKSVTITPNLLYQITMKLTVSSDGADGRVRRCGVIHTDSRQGASEGKAMGLTLATVRRKYGEFHYTEPKSITNSRNELVLLAF